MIEIAALWLIGKLLLGTGGTYGLARASYAAVNASVTHQYRVLAERNAQNVLTVAVDVEEDEEPQQVFDEAEAVPPPPNFKRRLLRALVVEARAEFGAPFGSVFERPIILEATRLKVGDYMRKICRDRHVRKKDMAELIDLAVDAYFIPSRRDVKRFGASGAALVRDRSALLDWVRKDGGPGWFGRFLIEWREGVCVGPRLFGPPGAGSAEPGPALA